MNDLFTFRFTGGVLEEVLHAECNNALEGSSSFAVLNAERAGVVILCDAFTGIVHVVSYPKRATASRSELKLPGIG